MPNTNTKYKVRLSQAQRKIDDLGDVPIRPATLPVGLIRHQQDPPRRNLAAPTHCCRQIASNSDRCS